VRRVDLVRIRASRNPDPHKIAEGRGIVTESTQPALRVVSGSPTPEELAVVTAVVAAAIAHGGGGEPEAGPARGTWSDPGRRFRPPLRTGRNGWRASAR
jgi:acyl-CoA carboxylase epsilon subunit